MSATRTYCLDTETIDGHSAVCRRSPGHGHGKSIHPLRREHYDHDGGHTWITPGPMAHVEFSTAARSNACIRLPRAGSKKFVAELTQLGATPMEDTKSAYLLPERYLTRLAVLVGTYYPWWHIAQQCRLCGEIRRGVDRPQGILTCADCAAK